MNAVGNSLTAWGVLVSCNGLLWLFQPARYQDWLCMSKLLSKRDFPLLLSPWTHMFAATGVVLGLYYISAGLENDRKFARRSVWGRLVMCALLVQARVPKGLLFLGISDVLGAAWTAYALHTS